MAYPEPYRYPGPQTDLINAGITLFPDEKEALKFGVDWVLRNATGVGLIDGSIAKQAVICPDPLATMNAIVSTQQTNMDFTGTSSAQAVMKWAEGRYERILAFGNGAIIGFFDSIEPVMAAQPNAIWIHRNVGAPSLPEEMINPACGLHMASAILTGLIQ